MPHLCKATLGICLLLGMADAATAQDKALDDTVTITAKKKPVVRRIDGTVYDESRNPRAASGTGADVLNSVPAVHVSPDGDVTLRGQGNVQVYVDGKPQAAMQGDSRAVTLQSMSGSDIASVEVITNPSAKYDANGGGIINIVLKKNRKPGSNGVLNANIGNGQRYNTALSGNATRGRLSLHGMIGIRRDMRRMRQSSDLMWSDPVSGASGRSVQHSAVNAFRASQSANAGLDYNATDKDTLSLNATYARRHSANRLDEFHRDLDGGGVVSDDYDRRSLGPRGQTDTGLTAGLDHRGKSGSELKLSLALSESDSRQDKSYRNIYSVPATPDTMERVRSMTGHRLDTLSGDYARPVGDAAQLSAGFSFQAEQNRFYNYNAGVDPVTGADTVNADRTNRFIVDQSLDAAYVTYQAPVGKWTVLAGLRLERVDTQTRQATSGVTHDRSYASLNPSLHATYDADDKTQWTASYSQSLQRPSPQDLNPFTVYIDAQNVTAGNPGLKPQKVSSLEAGYARATGPFSDSATIYYRTSAGTVTDYSYFIADHVLLTTKRNSGSGRSGGLDYSLDAKPSDRLSYSLDANLFFAELEAAEPGGRLKQSALSYTAQASLDYDRGDDSFEISGNALGPGLTAQGTRSATSSIGLAWKHRLTPRLSLAVNAMDIFNGGRQETVTRTSAVQQVAITHDLGPTLFLGLSWLPGRP